MTGLAEACHENGHGSRLGRNLTGQFGSVACAAEELVAELGAAMWCAQMASLPRLELIMLRRCLCWLRNLGTDARALVTVASGAQAAVDRLNTAAGYVPAGPVADALQPSIADLVARMEPTPASLGVGSAASQPR